MRKIERPIWLLPIGLLCAVIIYPFLHELGHSLTAILLGAEILQITWFPVPSVLCRMSSLNTMRYVLVGLSGVVFPVTLCLFISSNRFWIWYSIFVMRLIVIWSLILAEISLFLFHRGIAFSNDDITLILEKTPKLDWLYGLLIVALLFAVCISVSKSKPIQRISEII